MMFCPKCGALLVPKKKNSGTIVECSCGYTNKKKVNVEIKEVVKKQDKEIELVDEEVESLPLTEAECPKCGNKKAYFWMVQTRASDEPETKFLKCQKCKHIWRDYG